MNTSKDDKETTKNVFQVTTTIGSGKYLGMPSIIGRNKRAVFGVGGELGFQEYWLIFRSLVLLIIFPVNNNEGMNAEK